MTNCKLTARYQRSKHWLTTKSSRSLLCVIHNLCFYNSLFYLCPCDLSNDLFKRDFSRHLTGMRLI